MTGTALDCLMTSPGLILLSLFFKEARKINWYTTWVSHGAPKVCRVVGEFILLPYVQHQTMAGWVWQKNVEAAITEKSDVETLHQENWRSQIVTSKNVHRKYF